LFGIFGGGDEGVGKTCGLILTAVTIKNKIIKDERVNFTQISNEACS
jgi:hypothetical protein